MSDLPPLPAGFQLEGEQSGLPQLPAGFQLESAPSGGNSQSDGILQTITGLPSWAQAAGQQTQKDIAAYQSGGVPALMADTSGSQDLASGFAGSGTIRGVGKAIPAKALSSPALKELAGNVFEANKDVPVSPQAAAEIPAAISDSSLRAIPEVNKLAPKEPSYSPLERLQSEMNREPLPERPAPAAQTVQSLRDARMKLSEYAGETQDFKPTVRARAATMAINHIDDVLNDVAPDIKKANADYSAARIGETINFRDIRAQHRADKSGTGKNLENTMRQEVDKIPDRGLKPEEIAARNRIVEGSFARNRLREAGKIGFGDAIPTIYHLLAAAPTGGLSTILGLGGTVARKVGERMTKNEMQALSEMVRARAPSSMAQPAQLAPQTSSQQVIAALLSNALRRPGIGGVLPAYANEQK
jgi:hypothetical protein